MVFLLWLAVNDLDSDRCAARNFATDGSWLVERAGRSTDKIRDSFFVYDYHVLPPAEVVRELAWAIVTLVRWWHSTLVYKVPLQVFYTLIGTTATFWTFDPLLRKLFGSGSPLQMFFVSVVVRLLRYHKNYAWIWSRTENRRKNTWISGPINKSNSKI